jgi:hypothetical protein
MINAVMVGFIISALIGVIIGLCLGIFGVPKKEVVFNIIILIGFCLIGILMIIPFVLFIEKILTFR